MLNDLEIENDYHIKVTYYVGKIKNKNSLFKLSK